jgi:serine/threonine-protein kinase
MPTIAEAASPRGSAAALAPGAIVADRYRIVATLGAGAMGAVFLAEHVALGRRVALKTIHRELLGSAEAVARFEREALASARVDHPNVVAATDTVRLPDGSPGIVLEYVQGRSLAARIAEEGPVPVPEVLTLLEGLAGALVAAHAIGVVHRDLKPENLLLAERPGLPASLKILDFGIAKVVGESGAALAASAPGTQLGMVYGTPRYMAPEQAMGSTVDARADLYAVGVIAYEMLTGRVPYDGDDLTAIVTRQLTEPCPALPATVPRPLAALVVRLLDPKPDARPGSARALAEALREVTVADAAPAPSTAGARPVDRSPHAASARVRIVAAIGAALVVVVVGRFAASGGGGSSAGLTAFVAPSVASTEDLSRAKAAGRAALEDLAFRFPNDAAVVRALVDASHAEGLPLLVAKHLARLAELAPSEAEEIAGFAEAGAQRSDEAAAALVPLLAARLGARGLDALVSLADKKSPAKKAAQDALATEAVRARLTPAARVFVDVRAAKSCAERRALLPRMKSDGDARIAPFVAAWQTERGCGFLGLEDCHECLRGKEPRALLAELKARFEAP